MMSEKHVVKISKPIKPWWPGDERVNKYMFKVAQTIRKHIENQKIFTDIYNRCYEAVYEAICDYDKTDPEPK